MNTSHFARGIRAFGALAVLVGALGIAQVTTAEVPMDTWCPPMNSDACQQLNYDFDIEVAGGKFCCFELDN